MEIKEYIDNKLVHPDKRIRLFLEKISVDSETGCWLWTARLEPDGYGRFRDAGRSQVAHRWSYVKFVGPVPDGMELGHLEICKKRRHCVNYEHVRPVTHMQNMRDGTDSRHDTHCPHGHEFTAKNTHYRPNGQRHCRMCQRIRTAAWREKQKENA